MGGRRRAEDARLCQGSLGAASSARCPTQRGPRHQHFALCRAQGKGAGTTRHHQKACLRLSTRHHHAGRVQLQATEQAGAASGRPPARGRGIARHCPAARRCSNTHPQHLGISKHFPCTHLPTPRSPHGDAMRVPVPAPGGQGARRVGCSRRAARPGSRPAWHVASTRDGATMRTERRCIPRPSTDTVPPGVPPPAPGPCPKFLDAPP